MANKVRVHAVITNVGSKAPIHRYYPECHRHRGFMLREDDAYPEGEIVIGVREFQDIVHGKKALNPERVLCGNCRETYPIGPCTCFMCQPDD